LLSSLANTAGLASEDICKHAFDAPAWRSVFPLRADSIGVDHTTLLQWRPQLDVFKFSRLLQPSRGNHDNVNAVSAVTVGQAASRAVSTVSTIIPLADSPQLRAFLKRNAIATIKRCLAVSRQRVGGKLKYA